MIQPVTLNDADRIAEIYNEYILNSAITFEEAAITGDIIRLGSRRSRETGTHGLCLSMRVN